jgi:hypothetical protein
LAAGIWENIMAKKKWRANSKTEWDDRTPFQRFRWPVLAAVVVASLASLAWYRYENSGFKYGDNGYQEGAAMSNCIQDHTRQAANDDTTADAATACVQQEDNSADKNPAP